MMRRLVHARRLCLGILLLSLVVSFSLPPSTSAQNDIRYFPETGHYIGGFFRFFWETNGGLGVFGFPITEEYVPTSSGRITQYYERARFELVVRDGQYGVELGNLGVETTGNRIFPKVPPIRNTAARRYFPESQNILQNQFKRFWETQGGERIFGLPISEEITEILPDGKWHTVQYFERARFEYWPALPLSNRILLSHLGRVRAPSTLLLPLPPDAPPDGPIPLDDLEFFQPPPPPPTVEPTPAPPPTVEPTPVPPPTVEPTPVPPAPLPSERVNVPTPIPGGNKGIPVNSEPEPSNHPEVNPGEKDAPASADPIRIGSAPETSCTVFAGSILSIGDVEAATELTFCPGGFALDRDVDVHVVRGDGTEMERLRIPPRSYWFWPILPGDPKGEYNIRFTQGDKQAVATFRIVPAKHRNILIGLSAKTFPKSTPRGTTVPIALAGFERGPVALYLYKFSSERRCQTLSDVTCWRYVTRLPNAVINESRETIYGLVTRANDRPGDYQIRTDPPATGNSMWPTFRITP